MSRERETEQPRQPMSLARVARRIRKVPPFLILAAGWFFFFMHAYPGLMTRDSFDQLRQARTGIFLDDHPPMMQAIVWVIDPFVAGPIGPVAAQSLMMLAGTYLLLRRVMRARVAAVVAVAFLWLPPVVAVMTVMWKDPMMAGALMLATALITSECRRARIAGLALVVVATGVRFNALAATFAIVVLLFEWRAFDGTTWMRRAKRYGLALGVWVGLTIAAFGINTLLTDRETHFFETTLVDDMVGTLAWEKGTRSDAELRELFRGIPLKPPDRIHRAIRRAYRSDSMLPYVVGNERIFDLPLADVEPPSAEVRAALLRSWKEIVFGGFGAYLKYRADRFRVVIGLTKDSEKTWEQPIIVTHEYQDKNLLWQFGVSTTVSPMQQCIDDTLSWLSHTWLFRPWLYLALTLALLVMALRRPLVLALLLSGLGIELSLFFLAHSADYRYSHWMICTTLLAAILLFTDRLRGNPRAQ